MNGFQGLSERYMAELRKPRFSLRSTIALCLSSVGLGVIVGTIGGWVSHERIRLPSGRGLGVLGPFGAGSALKSCCPTEQYCNSRQVMRSLFV